MVIKQTYGSRRMNEGMASVTRQECPAVLPAGEILRPKKKLMQCLLFMDYSPQNSHLQINNHSTKRSVHSPVRKCCLLRILWHGVSMLYVWTVDTSTTHQTIKIQPLYWTDIVTRLEDELNEAVCLHVFFSVYFLLTQLSLLRSWTDSFPHRHKFSFYCKIIYTEVFNKETNGFGTLHGKICHLGILSFWANDGEGTINVGRTLPLSAT